METATVTIAGFIEANRISLTAKRTDTNPNMDDSANMDHWKCVLIKRAETLDNGITVTIRPARMTVYFSQGYGHNGKQPKADSVLDCLASDAASVENARSFEDWCGDLGYDSDSRKAEKIFKTVTHQAKRLKNLLGDAAFNTLLWNTERM